MSKEWIETDSGSAWNLVKNPAYEFGGDFAKGTAPTLLEASQAQIVIRFIRALMGARAVIQTGNVKENSASITFGDDQAVLDLWIKTALKQDQDPWLSNKLNLDGNEIWANQRGVVFKQFWMDGFVIRSDSDAGAIRLLGKNQLDPRVGGGFKGNNAWPEGGPPHMWILPENDGSSGQMLVTDGSHALSWSSTVPGGGGSGTVTSVATANGTFVNVTGGTITTTGTITGDLSATGTASATTFLRGDNTWAVPAGGGGSYSWTAKDGDDESEEITDGVELIFYGSTFVDVVLTPSGEEDPDITVSLSATGTPSSSTFLRGDNTWAVPAGGGGFTSFYVDGDNTSPQTVTDGNTVLIAGGTALTSVAAATDTVTINLDNTAVTAATYGSATQVGQFTVDAQGRLTSASNVSISGGGGETLWVVEDGSTNTTDVDLGNGSTDGLTFADGFFVENTLTSNGDRPYIVHDLSATGTYDETTFLRGDNTWAVPSGGGGGGMTSWDLCVYEEPICFTVTDGVTVLFTSDDGPITFALDESTKTIDFGVSIRWQYNCDEGDTCQVEVGYDGGYSTLWITGNYDPMYTIAATDPDDPTIDIVHGDSMVMEGTYGDADNIPVIEVDSRGHIQDIYTEAKTAIVKSLDPDPDSYVAVYCTESPEVRFEDVVAIHPPKNCRKFDYEIDPEFVHVCEPESIQAVGHTTSEPAIVGLRVSGGSIEIEFSELLPVPTELIVHLMGIRHGSSGKRFESKTEAQAQKNSHFWKQAHE